MDLKEIFFDAQVKGDNLKFMLGEGNVEKLIIPRTYLSTSPKIVVTEVSILRLEPGAKVKWHVQDFGEIYIILNTLEIRSYAKGELNDLKNNTNEDMYVVYIKYKQ